MFKGFPGEVAKQFATLAEDLSWGLQNSHDRSQPPVTPHPRDLTPSSSLFSHQASYGRYTHMQILTHKHKNKKILKGELFKL